MKIRPFRFSDLEPYAHTLLITLPCDDLNEAIENATSIVERLEQEEKELCVAEKNGIPVGFMLLEFELQDRNVEIDWFDIHPDCQRQGVGTALVQKAAERAKERGLLTVTIHTAASNYKMLRFAEKNGFANVARLQAFWGEGTEDAYLLQKRVD